MTSPKPLRSTLLRIEGADALPFAHAQFTSNVNALAQGNWQWSAWLDARGRVQHLFHLLRTGEQELLLALRGGEAVAMGERLQRYVFRDKVRLTAQDALYPRHGSALPAGDARIGDEGILLGMGDHSLLLATEPGDDTVWRTQAIERGEAWLPDAFLGSFLPPAVGLRRLGAMNLDKGCFPGQEIAARLHYRGGHKQVLMHVQLASPVAAGDTLPLHATDDAKNEIPLSILDCVGRDALAVGHEYARDLLAETPDARDDLPRLVRAFAA